MGTTDIMATTTARDPLMPSPRSLATPVSLEVSTVAPTPGSQLPMLSWLLRLPLLPSPSLMPPHSMLSMPPLWFTLPPLSTQPSTPPPWSSMSSTTPPWSEPTPDFPWLVFPWLPLLPQLLLRTPSKFHFRKENLIKMSLHHF